MSHPFHRLSNCYIPEACTVKIFDTFSHFENLKAFGRTYCFFEKKFLERLLTFVEECEHLEELDLSSTEITDSTIEILVQSLAGNTSIRRLHLSENVHITNRSIPALLELAKTTNITDISLYSTSLAQSSINEIHKQFSVLLEEREIPIKSNAKSAAKSSYN